MKATRDAYGHALLALAERDPRIAVLDSDLSRSTHTDWFRERFPDRHYNLGIAEANMIGVAAGMAMTGLVPFATTYAIFIGRAFDQIRQSVGYADSNVKIVATHGGLSASHDGGSHQGIEDLALMTAVPGMTVLSPADYHETYQALLAAAAHQGPVYLRLSKFATEEVTEPDEAFRIGRARVLREAGPAPDVGLLATGVVVPEALEAADKLRADGVTACVVNVPTLKPLDRATLTEVAGRCTVLLTVEEHSVHGGLFAAVAALLATGPHPPVHPVAMPDCYGRTGEWRDLLDEYGMTADHIAARARTVLDAAAGRS
ncbi:transketolase C-terminal domain-containing protein [Streptomyces sp. NPDC004647]|uniref:transketolase family protein n=1 Tax=Streptomyces sp. NPDC004647 TaxID=3154671 RepID=UPI0033BCC1BF